MKKIMKKVLCYYVRVSSQLMRNNLLWHFHRKISTCKMLVRIRLQKFVMPSDDPTDDEWDAYWLN